MHFLRELCGHLGPCKGERQELAPDESGNSMDRKAKEFRQSKGDKYPRESHRRQEYTSIYGNRFHGTSITKKGLSILTLCISAPSRLCVKTWRLCANSYSTISFHS